MKRLSIISFFIFFSFFASSHVEGAVFLKTKPIDSSYFKSRGLYLSVSPVMLSSSFNTDTKQHSAIFSGRLGINWTTRKHRKFQVFGAIGIAIKLFDQSSTKTNEFGFTVGKLYKDENSGFWDLNAGLSYFGRETRTVVSSGSFWDGSASTHVKVRQAHTFGIPFDATFYGSKLPLGLGIGVAGNLNIEQPYIGVLFRVRLGNPVLRMHSTSK